MRAGGYAYLRGRNGSLDGVDAVIYCAEDGRWYAVPREEVPSTGFIYVREGDPLPFEDRLRDSRALGSGEGDEGRA